MGNKKGKNSNYKANFTAVQKETDADERKNKIITAVCLSLLAVFVMSTVLVATLSSQEKMGTGACAYLETRDISGRDIKYVEVCIKNYGKMVILLDATTAPETVANFLSLVNQGFYDGLTIHRVMENFMIQGGDPEGNGMGGSSTTIKGEFAQNGFNNDLPHIKGVISMARSDKPDSASSQFFICNADSYSVQYLDGKYAAFGYVVEGLSVVEKITEKTVDYTTKGSGLIYKESKKPVIKYIKVLDSWGN